MKCRPLAGILAAIIFSVIEHPQGAAHACEPVQPCGDLDNSGVVTASDALLALRKSVGQQVNAVCECKADSVCGSQLCGPRFVDNGDGTVSDRLTGLMWEKKTTDGSIHDVDNKYTWWSVGEARDFNGTVVTVFLAGLNAGSGFAGHTDWRLPDIGEMHDIAKHIVARDIFGVHPEVDPEYWSSTPFAPNKWYAWEMSLYGGIGTANKDNPNYVYAVRGGV